MEVATATKVDSVQVMLDKMQAISDAIEAQSDQDKRKLKLAKLFNSLVDNLYLKLEDGTEPNRTALEEAGVDIDSIAEPLTEAAEVLAPKAGMSWSKDEVDATVRKLEALLIVQEDEDMPDLLTDEQAEQAKTVVANLSNLTRRSGGNGTRAPRTEQAPIEGRPFAYAQVSVTHPDTNEVRIIAKQAANKPNSVSNLRNAVKKALADAGITVTNGSEDDKAITTAVKNVVEEGNSEDTIAGIRIAGLAE